jgi:hypothetical protein
MVACLEPCISVTAAVERASVQLCGGRVSALSVDLSHVASLSDTRASTGWQASVSAASDLELECLCYEIGRRMDGVQAPACRAHTAERAHDGGLSPERFLGGYVAMRLECQPPACASSPLLVTARTDSDFCLRKDT